MVESDVVEDDTVGVDAVPVADRVLHAAGDVAQADGAVPGVEQGPGDDPHRVGEVDDPGAGGALGDAVGDVQGDGYGAQRLGEAARPGGLLADTAAAERARLSGAPGHLTADA